LLHKEIKVWASHPPPCHNHADIAVTFSASISAAAEYHSDL